VQVTISHPRIIETGMDLLSHPSLIFYESGYSLHTLRQSEPEVLVGGGADAGFGTGLDREASAVEGECRKERYEEGLGM
jgi:hypothetical protein